MFEAQKYLAATKPASIMVEKKHFNIVIEDQKVTVYHETRGISAVLYNSDIKNLGVAKITLTASKKRCAISLANNNSYIELQTVTGNLVVSLFNNGGEILTQLLIKE